MPKNNISIDTGELRITINDDPDRVLVFNPKDVVFAEKFFNLVGDFKEQLEMYKSRMVEIELVDEKDDNGLPVNASDRLDVLKETCRYVNTQIDVLFGEGTSTMLFGSVLNLEVFTQFFNGLIPFVEKARKEKVQKYTKKR